MQNNKILTMLSAEKESFLFIIQILTQSNVEICLNDLVSRMRQTMKEICSKIGQRIMIFSTEDWVTA
jgi:hypothetical protein